MIEGSKAKLKARIAELEDEAGKRSQYIKTILRQRDEADERVRVLERECGELEAQNHSLQADRNMTQDELDMYYELFGACRKTWWWKLFAGPIVERVRLAYAGRYVQSPLTSPDKQG
jgi:hypothetical protein